MIKRITIVFLLTFTAATLPLSAQHYIGVRAGYGGGSIRYEPSRETGLLMGFPSGGISWKYYSKVPYVGAVETDLQFVQKGFKEYPRVDSDTTYERRIQAIELPLIWQPHIYFANQKVRTFLNLGVYFSRTITSDTTFIDRKNNIKRGPGTYTMRLVRDNSWEYGLMGGFGIGVLFNQFEVIAEARYSYGYSDLFKSGTKYSGNPQRSPIDMINISVGFYYQLGKPGLLIPPPKERVKNNKKRNKNGIDATTEN